MVRISVVINTLNEEKNLPQALVSIKDFADEIVVVDMNSEDKTRQIARKAGARVYIHKKTGYVEPARNYAIEKATGDWILILDADERLSSSLSSTLSKIVKEPKADYYRLPRKNYIFGKWVKHSRWWPDYNIKFFKKGYVSWSEVIHSVPMTKGKGLDLEVKEENAIIHFHYDSIGQYLERLNRYTKEHAKNKLKDGYKFTWIDLIKRPSNEFLSRFFQGAGYKDGIHGLALSGLQAFSELVLYLRLWEATKFKDEEINVKKVIEEMRRTEDDFHYWQADTLLKMGGGLKQRVKRKFKIR